MCVCVCVIGVVMLLLLLSFSLCSGGWLVLLFRCFLILFWLWCCINHFKMPKISKMKRISKTRKGGWGEGGGVRKNEPSKDDIPVTVLSKVQLVRCR